MLILVFVLLLLTITTLTAFAENPVSPSSETSPLRESQPLWDITVGTNEREESTTDANTGSERDTSFGWFNASDMVNTGVGAAAGFFLSMLLEDWLRRQRKRKSIINIALELKDIKVMIDSKKDATTPALSYAIYTPIWETVVGNGDILELRKKPYYDDLFLIYGHISRLAKMEDFAQGNGIENMSKIIEQREYIIKLLSSNFEEHQLYSLLEKYAK